MNAIEHRDRLTSIFGQWPSFHDAEVIRLVLDRAGPEAPTLETQIHVFAATPEVDSTGHHVLTKHMLVTLRFTDVDLESLDSFNEQNVLFELSFSSIPPVEHEGRGIRVEMASSFGLAAAFECKRAIVTGVEPYEAAA